MLTGQYFKLIIDLVSPRNDELHERTLVPVNQTEVRPIGSVLLISRALLAPPSRDPVGGHGHPELTKEKVDLVVLGFWCLPQATQGVFISVQTAYDMFVSTYSLSSTRDALAVVVHQL